jgi:hypothetical protein
MRDSPPPSAVVSTPTRRRVLAGAGALAAAGATYLTVGPTGVQAAVTTDGFTVGDGEHGLPGGDVYSPVVELTAAWEYAGADAAARVLVAALIGGDLVADTVIESAAGSDSGTTPLQATVVASDAWSSSDWQAPADGQVSHDVTTKLLFEVRDAEGATLASATASDTATITVRDTGPALSASVGGEGSVTFIEREGETPQS